jgi:hypothetical protein
MRPEAGQVSDPDSGRRRHARRVAVVMRERRPEREVYRAYDELAGDRGVSDGPVPAPPVEFRGESSPRRAAGVVMIAGLLGTVGLLLVLDSPRSRVVTHPSLAVGQQLLRPAPERPAPHLTRRYKVVTSRTASGNEQQSLAASAGRPSRPAPGAGRRIEPSGDTNPGSSGGTSSGCEADREFGFESCQ